MKSIRIIYRYILLLFTLSIILFSCSREESSFDADIPEGYGLLNIETVDIEYQEENLGKDNSKASAKILGSDKDISTAITTNNAFSCKVELEEEGNSSDLKSKLKNGEKSGAIVRNQVASSVKYRVYVFDKNTGKLAASGLYTRGQESTGPQLKINGGKEYTVVAYSINSTTSPAQLENATDLNTATITNENVDFMFQKQDIMVPNQSNQKIKITFRHQYTQITTTIKLDAATAAYSYIRGAGGASYITPGYSKTKFKISDESIEGLEAIDPGVEVKFPFIPFTNTTTKTLKTTTPTIINLPITTAGKMVIEALTIGGVTRTVVVENLKFSRGVRYNLNLTFHVPETTEFSDNPVFHFVDKVSSDVPFTHTVKLNKPTYGAQVDIWYLDNSFNLNINGENLFSKEVNFEGFTEHDTYFSDYTYYGVSGISVIYRINETAPRDQIPVVRLTIDENGNVALYGRKSMSQNLRDLFLRSNITINKNAKLNPNGDNTLIFSSTRWTITDVQGRIYGIRLKN